ncbi:MAG: hypothetical protein AAFV95_07270 [Bacteroidota bacterium]
MDPVDCTLLCDGSSDRMLIPSIKWLLVEYFPDVPFKIEYADIRRVLKANTTLSEKICVALELFPCKILFVQRDTERENFDSRLEEIQLGIENANCKSLQQWPHIIPVIPQRMSEAWLLIDEYAIKRASGNPNSNADVNLPKVKSLETLPDPKDTLIKLLKKATGLNNRRLRRFNPYSAIHIVAQSIEDYSPLRQLHSFSMLEKSISELELPQLVD